MRKAAIFVLALFLSGCSVPVVGGKKAGMKITTSPPATIIVDGKQLGQTPFEERNFKSKAHKLQLIPQSGQPWETTIALHGNTLAIVERIFGNTDQESEGYTMELEEGEDKSRSELTVITIPDLATVRIDGQPKGFGPVNTELASEGGHEVTISSAGYNEKRVPVSVPKGYRLILTVQLSRAKLPEPTPSATPSASPETEGAAAGKPTATPTPKAKSGQAGGTPTPSVSRTPTVAAPTIARPYVEILTTPTGWLRVRSEPSSSADNEITKINPGETYKFIEPNDTGWYKIELTDGQQGWISGQYAKLYR